MITDIRIENFKNFERFEFSGFKRVNLLAGKNNVGKTNLMEAIHLHRNGFSPWSVVNSLILRGIKIKSDLYLAYDPGYLNNLLEAGLQGLFKRNTESFSIKINDEEAISGYIRNFRSEFIQTDQDNSPKQIKRILENGNDPHLPKLIQVKAGAYQYDKPLGLPVEELSALVAKPNETSLGFIWPTNDNLSLTEGNLNRVRELGLFQSLIESLSFLGYPISDLFFKEDPLWRTKSLRFTKNGEEGSFPISELGFGIQRLIAILTEVLTTSGSSSPLLLIDEIDLGIHHSLMKKFWSQVFTLAAKLNVQIFATTHSRDCTEAFARVSQEFAGEGLFLRLEEFKGNIHAIGYSEEEILIAAESQYEVR